MFLKRVLNQPNLVGTMLIALMVCAGFVYAFAFDGFNVETATGSEVEAWLAQAGASNSSPSYTCSSYKCKGSGNAAHQYSGCPARKGIANCTNCAYVKNYCKTGCKHGHSKCATKYGCPQANKKYGGCSKARNSKTNKTQTTCPTKCK